MNSKNSLNQFISKRAILYARVSGDDRKNENINLEGQLDMGRDYAQKNGWVIVAELAEDDRGARGASFELPMLNKVREMARAGEFDVLVVREIDRLSRKLSKQLIVEEQLKRTGVYIEYVLGEYPDNPEGNLMKHVRATIAEYEREKINERMVRGRWLRVKSGRFLACGRIAYGYRAIQNENGQFHLEILESEAKIIRMIFGLYIGIGDEKLPLSYRKIAEKLTQLGVPTFGDIHGDKVSRKRKPGQWNSNSVGIILKNETYIGKWQYGKTSEEDAVYVNVPAIISHEIWNKVQEQREKNKLRSRRNRKNDYLLAGSIRCGKCQSALIGSTVTVHGGIYGYYRCNARRNPIDYGFSCDMPYLRVDHADKVVWEWIRSQMSNPDDVVNGVKDYLTKKESEKAPLRERLTIVNDLLAKCTEELENALDLCLTGSRIKNMLMERINHLEVKFAALEKERAEIVASLRVDSISEVQVEALKEFTSHLGQAIEIAENDFEARRHIIHLLNMKTTLILEGKCKILSVKCAIGEDFLCTVPRAING